jgi:hypothetical protein
LIGDRYLIDDPFSQWTRRVLAMFTPINCASLLSVVCRPGKKVFIPIEDSIRRGIQIELRLWTASIPINANSILPWSLASFSLSPAPLIGVQSSHQSLTNDRPIPTLLLHSLQLFDERGTFHANRATNNHSSTIERTELQNCFRTFK